MGSNGLVRAKDGKQRLMRSKRWQAVDWGEKQRVGRSGLVRAKDGEQWADEKQGIGRSGLLRSKGLKAVV